MDHADDTGSTATSTAPKRPRSAAIDMDGPREPVYAARFACHVCGEAPLSYPTRCLKRGCFALICGVCGVQSQDFQKCPVCGTRAKAHGGVAQAQLIDDHVLGDALRRLFPELTATAPCSHKDLRMRHADAVMRMVGQSWETAELRRLPRNKTYVEDMRALIIAHAVTGDLSKFVETHLCDCNPPHLCCPRRTNKGVVRGCPVYDYAARGGKRADAAAGASGCRYFRRE